MTSAEPARKPFANFREGTACSQSFDAWLSSGGYSPSTRAVTRSPCEAHWFFSTSRIGRSVLVSISTRPAPDVVQKEHLKGLKKFAEFLNEGKPVVHRVNWEYHLNGLSDELCEHMRDFVAYRQKNWRMEDRYKRTLELLSQTCTTLRWMNSAAPLRTVADITPQVWFAFLDEQMVEDMRPVRSTAVSRTCKPFCVFWRRAAFRSVRGCCWCSP